MPRTITSAADLPQLNRSLHDRKAWRRSAKYLRACMNLAAARQVRLQTQRDANPRTTKEEQMSTFVDPRSKVKLAETLAPVPAAKKRTYKAKPKEVAAARSRAEVLDLVKQLGPHPRKTARIYGTKDEDGI